MIFFKYKTFSIISVSFFCLAISNCSFVSNANSIGQVDTTLKAIAPFPVGGAVKINLLRNDRLYRNLLIKEYNSLTAENAMKFVALHPGKDSYRWEDADYIVNFALDNNIRVHGHTLIWPRVNPPWVTTFKGSRNDWKRMLKTHIQTVVKHFKGKVKSWDVVNEAFEDNGTYKDNVWLRNIGKDYIELCFKYAREADPNVLLFYNDYGHEYSTKKLQAVLNLVKDFKSRNIPIDGLGLQMHTVVRVTDLKIKNAINAVASTGLLIHLSELEVAINYQQPKSFIPDKTLLDRQASKYASIVKAYLSIPKKQQYGITTWNVGDKDSWKNSKGRNHDHPLLFDYQYQPKPAYKAFKLAAEGKQ